MIFHIGKSTWHQVELHTDGSQNQRPSSSRLDENMTTRRGHRDDSHGEFSFQSHPENVLEIRTHFVGIFW